MSLYLLGMDSKSNHILDNYLNIVNPKNSEDTGILWSREFSEKIKPNSTKEQQLEQDIVNILEQYNIKNNPGTRAKYVAVGHTPQFHSGKGINSVCNGRVWRCDVGMSKAFGDSKEAARKPQVLEILNDNIDTSSCRRIYDFKNIEKELYIKQIFYVGESLSFRT